MEKIVGNDISEWQGDINWDVYKNNTHFVIIRATVGTARVDKKFIRNRDSARSRNIPLGFYHYSYPQYNTPEAEADFVCSELKDIREGEVIVLDFEEQWSGNHVDFCKRFLDRVQSKLNGYKPLIYLNQSQLKSLNWLPVANAGYGLWVAAYTYDPNNNNFVTGAWKFAAIQQWTNKQVVPGIPGLTDGNVFFGSVSSFKKYGYRSPAPIPPPSDPCANVKQQLEEVKNAIVILQKKYDDLQTKTTIQLADKDSECLRKLQDYKTKITNLINSLA